VLERTASALGEHFDLPRIFYHTFGFDQKRSAPLILMKGSCALAVPAEPGAVGLVRYSRGGGRAAKRGVVAEHAADTFAATNEKNLDS